MSVLDEVLADLLTEGDLLRAAVAELSEAAWRTPTPAEGWDVATQVAHLAWADEAAVAAATDKGAWDLLVSSALDDPTGFVDAAAAEVAAVPPVDLLARWDAARTDLADALATQEGRLPWFGPPMSPTSMAAARLMETWAHGLDVYAALGITPEPSSRIRHVAHLGARTRDFGYAVHGQQPPAEPFRVELTSPDGEIWAYGPSDAVQRVTGPAYDFCLLVTQRVHRDDTDLVGEGTDAEHWLTIAQAFAGPPGEGRAAS